MVSKKEKKKILIVDDDNFSIEFERAFLQREHFEIITARNGREALAILRENAPDLVLTDLYMPDMGGLELVVRARAEGMIDLPIIMVSKEDDPEKMTELKEAGATDFIAKPVEIDELMEKINLYLNESNRSSRRLPVAIKLRYRTLDELLAGESKDLSTTGMFVRTKKELGMGSLVELFLYPADDAEAEPIKVMGEVVQTVQDDDDNTGAGLKFINLEPQSVALITSLLEEEREHFKIDVLVVDDDRVIREMLYDALAGEGWKVKAIDNAIDALKELDKLNPSMILADIMMPQMDGIEFCSALRKNASNKDVPFIFISSKVDKDTLMAAKSSGATFFIAKPFDVETIVAKVRETIGDPQPS